MIDTLKFYNKLKERLDPEAALTIAEIVGQMYSEFSNLATRTEFKELREAVAENTKAIKELAEAQRRTEQRVEELAEAQKRTEERLDSLTIRVEELAEAQKRTEQRVEELAEAQKRTEERLDSLTIRVEELAEAQKRTEQRVEELAVAQAKTEKTLQKLTQRVDKISQELGGISNTIGYRLEDESYSKLKPILKKRFGIEVERLYRKNIVYTLDRFDEINIYGEGRRNGQELVIIGESKAQFGPRDVKKFLQLIERVKKHLGTEVFPLVLAYQFHPRAEAEFNKLQIPIFWSYELLEE